MDDVEGIETVELDTQRFIALESSRRWPRYVIAWSVRQRSGDSDFPLAHGEVESMPPEAGKNLDDMWAQLRQDAIDQATAAAGEAPKPAPKQSFIGRLFRRG